MAQVREVRLVDDLDGSEAEESFTFTVDGVDYEIDLNAKHAQAFRESFEEWVGAARKIKRVAAASRARVSAAQRRAAADKEQNQAIRDWAHSQGHKVAARGRIPASIVEAFHQAH